VTAHHGVSGANCETRRRTEEQKNQKTRNEDTVKNFGTRMALVACALSMLTWWSPAPRRRAADGAASRVNHSERGDVPGWVMITLMSAVLVAALLALAGPALEGLFNQAMDKVGQ
jgi:hypothetical protein